MTGAEPGANLFTGSELKIVGKAGVSVFAVPPAPTLSGMPWPIQKSALRRGRLSAESVGKSVRYLKPALDAFDALLESIHDMSVLDDFAVVRRFIAGDACDARFDVCQARHDFGVTFA